MALIHIQTELFIELGETIQKDRCYINDPHQSLSFYVVGGVKVQLLNQKPVLH